MDYPLSVEKIFIEHRNKAMYANDMTKSRPSPRCWARSTRKPSTRPATSTCRRRPPARALRLQGNGGRQELRHLCQSPQPAREAILLKKGAKASGELVTGFLPETDNYAFIVWHDDKGATSKPSAPFKFMLHDEFAEK